MAEGEKMQNSKLADQAFSVTLKDFQETRERIIDDIVLKVFEPIEVAFAAGPVIVSV